MVAEIMYFSVRQARANYAVSNVPRVKMHELYGPTTEDRRNDRNVLYRNRTLAVVKRKRRARSRGVNNARVTATKRSCRRRARMGVSKRSPDVFLVI